MAKRVDRLGQRKMRKKNFFFFSSRTTSDRTETQPHHTNKNTKNGAESTATHSLLSWFVTRRRVQAQCQCNAKAN
jgi:hypothetical protein